MVSIAGPYRKGKSFVLSEAFNQPQVFPLGHHIEPETMGIWLSGYLDSAGQVQGLPDHYFDFLLLFIIIWQGMKM